MIATTFATFIVLAVGCLIFDYYGWRQVSRGFTVKRRIYMGLAWITIISGLALIISIVQA
jgi:hypothetical protein